MILRIVALLTSVFGVAIVSGCQSPQDSRIGEKRELFTSLPPEVQKIIKDGMVDVGFTPDMVYLSLGKPNHTQSGEAVQGRMTTWTYKNIVLSDTVAMKLGLNTPGTRYQPGTMVSPNAPGGPSIGSTRNSSPQSTVSDIADAKVGTLFVEFLNEKVFSLRMER